MAATAAQSHESPREGGKDENPQEFLNGLMRELDLDSRDAAAFSPQKISDVLKAPDSPLENSRGSTIELTEETHSVDHSPRGKEKPVEPAATNETAGWTNVVRKTRGVQHAKNQWRQRAGIKPLDKPLTGPNGEPLSPEEYGKHRLEMRKRELIGRTIEGELIPREKGKGYFIKWNRWRHDRVFMSASCVESLLGPRPKPGTMIRCTINRLGPDHVPWNRQNPVSNEVEHWYIRPSGFMHPSPGQMPMMQQPAQPQMGGYPQESPFRQADFRGRPYNRSTSYSKQQWEYSGVCTAPQPTYQMPPGNGYETQGGRSRSGSFRGQGSPAMNAMNATNGIDAFSERPRGRAARAGSWRSPSTMSRQVTDQSLSSLSRLNTEESLSSMPAINLGSRFMRPQGSSGSLTDLTRTSTGGSNRSAGSPKK